MTQIIPSEFFRGSDPEIFDKQRNYHTRYKRSKTANALHDVGI